MAPHPHPPPPRGEGTTPAAAAKQSYETSTRPLPYTRTTLGSSGRQCRASLHGLPGPEVAQVSNLRRHPRRRDSATEISAGAAVFKKTGGRTLLCLVLDRFGMWTLPKGHVEAGESPLEAAQREVAEEVGLRRLAVVAPLGASRYRYRRAGALVRKTVHWYLMRARPDARLRPTASEGIHGARWLPVGRALRECGYAGVRRVLAKAGRIAGTEGPAAEPLRRAGEGRRKA